MESYTERAIPATLLPLRPKIVAPGIKRESLEWVNSNTIPQPTQAGQEIQFFIPQYERTYLDTQSTYLVISCNVVLSYPLGDKNSTPLFNHNANGCILGSFYSLFYRYTVWANTNTTLDDIIELGIVALTYLRLSMSKGARQTMSSMLGFADDFNGAGNIIGRRIKGPGSQGCRNDSFFVLSSATLGAAALNTVHPVPQGFDNINEFANAQPVEVRMQNGCPVYPTQTIIQDFQFAIPLIGALGVTNDNLYYLGLGQTRVSFFLENPQNCFLLPPVFTKPVLVPPGNIDDTTGGTAPGGATTPLLGTITAGGLSFVSLNITRARLIGNILTLSPEIWQQIMPSIMQSGYNRLEARVTSFSVSTSTIPQGSAGTLQLLVQQRYGSLKSAVAHFNPTTGCNNNTYVTIDGTSTTNNLEITNYFGKYGSINPGCTANTAFSIHTEWYPKIGLDPTNYPHQTLAYIMDCLNTLNSAQTKPSISDQNWFVADPCVCALPVAVTNNQGPVPLSGIWRPAPILAFPQFSTLYGTNVTVGTKTFQRSSAWWLQTLLTQKEINWWDFGGSSEILSNEFFLYWSFETAVRPGMISGKNTMDGSNYLNLNLIAQTTYGYTVYIIGAFDAVLVHDFDTGNVSYIK